MTIKNTENQGYVAPVMKAIEIRSEGLLCVSSPENTIDSASLEDWGTL